MATFKEQVNTITQISISATSTPTLTELSTFLTDGVKDVIQRVISINPSKSDLFTQTGTDTGAGQSAPFGLESITSVVREHDSTSILRPASAISANDRYEATNVDSLKFRSKYNPVFYYKDETVYVLPVASASGDNRGFITRVVAVSAAHGESTLSSMPSQYERLVVLYAAMKVLLVEINRIPNDLPSDITATSEIQVPSLSVTAPTLPEPPSNIGPPSFTLPTFEYEDVELGYSHLGSTLSSLVSQAPVFNAPALYVPTLATLNNLVIPGLPAVPSLSIDYKIESSSTSSDLNYNIIEPVFNKPGLGIPSDPGFDSFVIVAIPPGPPPVPSFTNATDLTIATLGLPAAPVFVKPSVPGTRNELFDITAVSSVSVGDAVDLSKLYDIVAEYIITEEDTEMSSAIQGHIGSIMTAYNAQVTTNMNEYTSSAARYQQEVAAETSRIQRVEANQKDNRDHNLTRETQQYGQELAAWNARLQEYTSAIQKEQNEYTTDTNLKMQVWQADVANSFNLYTNDMQGSMNEYQKELTIYQQKIQLATSAASNVNLEDNQKLALFSQEMAQHQANVANALQEFQQNEIHNKFTVWNQEFGNELNKFTTILSAEQQRYTSEVTEYNLNVTLEMQNLNNENAALQARMQAQTQLNTTNKQQKITTEMQSFSQKSTIEQAEYAQQVQNFTNQLSLYTQDLSKYTQQHSLEITNYNSELQEFSSSLQARTSHFNEVVQEFNLNTQKITVHIQHLITRYASIKSEYDEAFGLEKMTAASQQSVAQQQSKYTGGES